MSWQDAFGSVANFVSLEVPSTIIVAALSALGTAIGFYFGSHIVSAEVKSHTEVDAFNKALSSDHLPTLGKYLRATLGEVPTETYLDDRKIQDRIDRYLAKIAFLVRPPEEAASAEARPQEVQYTLDQRVDPSLDVRASDPSPIRKAVGNMREGETWSALALLRRDLERRLRGPEGGAAPRSGPPYEGIEDKSLRKLVRRFWFIASRAIHGDEITAQDAAEAVGLAREIYQQLDSSHPVAGPG